MKKLDTIQLEIGDVIYFISSKNEIKSHAITLSDINVEPHNSSVLDDVLKLSFSPKNIYYYGKTGYQFYKQRYVLDHNTTYFDINKNHEFYLSKESAEYVLNEKLALNQLYYDTLNRLNTLFEDYKTKQYQELDKIIDNVENSNQKDTILKAYKDHLFNHYHENFCYNDFDDYLSHLNLR